MERSKNGGGKWRYQANLKILLKSDHPSAPGAATLFTDLKTEKIEDSVWQVSDHRLKIGCGRVKNSLFRYAPSNLSF